MYFIGLLNDKLCLVCYAVLTRMALDCLSVSDSVHLVRYTECRQVSSAWRIQEAMVRAHWSDVKFLALFLSASFRD